MEEDLQFIYLQFTILEKPATNSKL